MAKKKKKKKKSLKYSTNPKIYTLVIKSMNNTAKALAREKAELAASQAKKQTKAKTNTKQASAKKAANPGQFGTFGSTITFEVKDPYNDNGNRSFVIPSKIERQSRGRWTTYNLLGRKPVKSFEGPDAATIMLSITLSADQGANPRTILDNIVSAIEKGTVDSLVIGGKSMGKYYIESMGDSWERFYQGGKLTRATGEITFAEYA